MKTMIINLNDFYLNRKLEKAQANEVEVPTRLPERKNLKTSKEVYQQQRKGRFLK